MKTKILIPGEKMRDISITLEDTNVVVSPEERELLIMALKEKCSLIVLNYYYNYRESVLPTSRIKAMAYKDPEYVLAVAILKKLGLDFEETV